MLISNLKSGLSVPYFSKASLYVNLGKGSFISIPFIVLNKCLANPSNILRMSS